MIRIVFAISMFLAFTAAHAASFNCAKATTKVEKIVCNDEEISGLDDLLSDLYNRTYDNFIKSNYQPVIITSFVKDQKQWLKSVRNACKDAACVKMAYERRINEIGLQIDENDLSFRSLTLKCSYSANPAAPAQMVLIGGAVYSRGEPAKTKEFSAGSGQPQHVELVVQPGQFAECVYPSGFRVRVKVGEGMSYPYGMCGADAEVFLSLWVNKKKVASRVWFAGHCREDSNENPPVTYTISAIPCSSSTKTADSSNNEGQSTGSTYLCADAESLNKFPADPVEYPGKGVKTPKVGEYELVAGTDKACSVVMAEMTKGNFPKQTSAGNTGEIEHPYWKDTEDDLPDDMLGGGSARESKYDFDNDGNLDRVISLSYMTHYMDATVLLVQPGKSPKSLVPLAPLQDMATLSVPCQVTGQPSNFNECPPYTQKWDEAGFAFGEKTGENAVYFRSRYSSVEPFLYRGKSYILVRNGSGGEENYWAILKPMTQRRFEHTCLIRQVVENY